MILTKEQTDLVKFELIKMIMNNELHSVVSNLKYKTIDFPSGNKMVTDKETTITIVLREP